MRSIFSFSTRCLRPTLNGRSFSNSLNGKVLVIASHDNTSLKTDTLCAISAASQISPNVSVLVAGSGNVPSLAKEASSLSSVRSVITVDSECQKHMLPENLVPLLLKVQHEKQFSHILAPSNGTFKNIFPRLGALLDVMVVSDVCEILDEHTFKRPTYAGNSISTLKSLEDTKLITIRATNFDPASKSTSSATVEEFPYSSFESTKSSWKSESVSKSERPELTSAKRVVSGGRGLKSAANFEMIYTLADTLGAAVGASRAAVDAEFISNDHQIGQTGKIVAPDLYIAIGISGAIQHLAGIKDSKCIVAINKDKEAPIFQIADYGLVSDLFSAVPELEREIKKL